MAIKGMADAYWNAQYGGDMTKLKSRLDYFYNLGFNTYLVEYRPNHVWETKNSQIDYFQEAIAHAHSKGMVFKIIINWYKWATNEDRYLFYTTPANKAAFLTDFEWIVSRYPTVDGIGIEEPLFYFTAAGAVTFWNDLHTRLNTIVTTYRDISNPDIFQWNFGVSSNVPAAILAGGTDLEFIKSNHLYNTYVVANGGLHNQTVSKYIEWLDLWKSYMPGYRIENFCYISSDGIFKNCVDQGIVGDAPLCYNQGFFDQFKYSVQNSIHVIVFQSDLTGRHVRNWPNDSTPGATIPEKLQYILKLSSECPTPQYTYNITQE